jgi:hypothetical protein
MADIFAAVDLTSVAAFALGAIVVIIGYHMIFKGGDVAKRVIRKA